MSGAKRWWSARRPGEDECPARDECAEHYRAYIDAVPDGDIVETLVAQGRRMAARLRDTPADRGGFRYARGKWTVREVVGHLIDTERVFAYRAAHIARGDPAPLPDMDPDAWTKRSNAATRSLRDLTEEFEAVRASTVALFRGLEPGAWARRGSTGGREVTARVLAWVIAGHAIHHEEVLGKKYGL